MAKHSHIKGRIILLPFPFDDLTGTKVRPAVCLTDSISSHRHVIVAFISSKVLKEVQKTDVAFKKSHPDFSQTGLKVSSVIRLHRLLTISTKIIQRELGLLSPHFQKQIDQKLKELFEI